MSCRSAAVPQTAGQGVAAHAHGPHTADALLTCAVLECADVEHITQVLPQLVLGEALEIHACHSAPPPALQGRHRRSAPANGQPGALKGARPHDRPGRAHAAWHGQARMC